MITNDKHENSALKKVVFIDFPFQKYHANKVIMIKSKFCILFHCKISSWFQTFSNSVLLEGDSFLFSSKPMKHQRNSFCKENYDKKHQPYQKFMTPF